MDRDTIKAEFPRVSIEKARGKTFFYYRHGRGARVRLPDDPATPEFAAAYKAAATGQTSKMPDIPTGTMQWLIEAFRRTDKHKSAPYVTRMQREKYFDKIERQQGKYLISHVKREHIEEILDAYEKDRDDKVKRQGRYWLDTMKCLFKFAKKDLKLITINPAEGIRNFTPPKIIKEGDRTGHLSWSPAHIAKFRKAHPLGTAPRFWIELALFTGLRRSDLVLVGDHHVKDGIIEIVVQKGRAAKLQTAYIPMNDEFQAILDASPIGRQTFDDDDNPINTPWLRGPMGKPMTAKNFGYSFNRYCSELKIPRSIHGLRRTSAEADFEAGATVVEAMAKHAWSTPAMAHLYGQDFDRRKMALSAAAKRAEASKGKAKSANP